MVSAHYDDFSVAPGMSGGGNWSGAVALLSLIRLFKSLYKHPATRPELNMLFLLTGGSGLDFMGLKQWLKTADIRILDSVEFVISLDELSGLMTEEGLYLHYSKPPKDQIVADWYQRFERAADMEGLKLNMVHKKINLALPYMTWEHEHVAQQRLLGATLSGQKEGTDPMLRSSVLDGSQLVDRETLHKAIKIVGSAIADRLYKEEGREFPAYINLTDSLSERRIHFIQKWLHSMGHAPRMAPFTSPLDPFGESILKFLKANTDRGSYSTSRMDPDYVFYDGIKVEVGAYKTAGVLFDLLLIVAVFVYLTLLFVSLKVVTQGWDALIALFKPAPLKRKKVHQSNKSGAHRFSRSAK